jgi:hypothetical protein
MDESFQLRARRPLDMRRPAKLDFSVLTATLAAQRSASAAARAQPHAPPGPDAGAEGEPLIEIVLAGPDLPRAACAQRGCFNRAESIRRRNTP